MKVVEVSNPALLHSSSGSGGSSSSDRGIDSQMHKLVRSPVPSLSAQQEERLIARRLEGEACAFTAAMTRRLEEHRQHLEQRLALHRRFIAQEAAISGVVAADSHVVAATTGKNHASWALRVRQHLQTERAKLVKAVAAGKERLAAVEKEIALLIQMRSNLKQNVEHWRGQLLEAQNKLREIETQQRIIVAPLECRVQQLMAKLDCGGSASGGKEAEAEEKKKGG